MNASYGFCIIARFRFCSGNPQIKKSKNVSLIKTLSTTSDVFFTADRTLVPIGEVKPAEGEWSDSQDAAASSTYAMHNLHVD